MVFYYYYHCYYESQRMYSFDGIVLSESRVLTFSRAFFQLRCFYSPIRQVYIFYVFVREYLLNRILRSHNFSRLESSVVFWFYLRFKLKSSVGLKPKTQIIQWNEWNSVYQHPLWGIHCWKVWLSLIDEIWFKFKPSHDKKQQSGCFFLWGVTTY